ncbi:MAG: hypothetical protein M0R76_13215 [Proteobacteria bacterium]|nr:hypothetical protein [Pseudomonadota bacterium]
MEYYAPEGFCIDDGTHVKCTIDGAPIAREVVSCANIEEGDVIKPVVVEGPSVGDDCDPGSFVSLCLSDRKTLVCEEDANENTTFVAATCAAENPICKRGQCVVAEEGAACSAEGSLVQSKFVEHCDQRQNKALYCLDGKVRALDCTGIQGTSCGVSVGGVADCYPGCSAVGETVSVCDIEWYQRPVSRQYTCEVLRNGEYGAAYTGSETCLYGCDEASGLCR